MADTWEAFQEYQRTAVVLDHFDYEINTVLGGVHTEDGEQRSVKVMLLAGSDLISTMSEPGVWSYADVGPHSNVLSFRVDRLSDGAAGSHIGTLRHIYRRASRVRYGPSNGQSCQVAG
jgi:hypothetical protein